MPAELQYGIAVGQFDIDLQFAIRPRSLSVISAT
jgi:hypothetical protein